MRHLRVMVVVVTSATGCSQSAKKPSSTSTQPPPTVQCDFGKPLSDECRTMGESAPPDGDATMISADAAVPISVGPADAKGTERGTAAPVKSRWTYDSSKDEMKGTTEQTALLESDNQVELAWPWDGGTRVNLYLSHVPNKPDAAFLWVDRGSFDCAPGYAGCDFQAKFDDGPLETFHAEKNSAGEAPDQMLMVAACTPGNATCARNTKAPASATSEKWLAKLKASKRVIIETAFTKNGSKQFTFTTAGLEWPPPRSR